MKKRLLSLFLSFALMINPITVFASETQETDKPASMSCTVTAAVQDNSQYVITVPKTLTLDSETFSANYNVNVEGGLNEDFYVNVIPDETFTMTQGSKTVDARVVQDKLFWCSTEVDGSNIANGTVQSEELSGGDWIGVFNFNIELLEVASRSGPGAYDARGVLLADWSELEDMGFDVDSIDSDFGDVYENNDILKTTYTVVMPNELETVEASFSNVPTLNEIVYPEESDWCCIRVYSCNKFTKFNIPTNIAN
jgi:hypothetical protein